jgi:hypothetical protein
MRYEFQNPQLNIHQYDIFSMLAENDDDFHKLNQLGEELEKIPHLALLFIKYNYMTNQQRRKTLLDLFACSHNFFMILGTVGSGKTALAYYLTKAQETNKKVYWVGKMNKEKCPTFATHIYLDKSKVKLLKKQGKSVFDLFDKGSIIFFDEISHIFPKGSIGTEELEELTVYRHKEQTIIGATQNSSIISIDLLRFFTGIFILQTTLFHTENERDNTLIDALMIFKPKKHGQVAFYSAMLENEFFIKFTYPLLKEYDKIAGKGYGET